MRTIMSPFITSGSDVRLPGLSVFIDNLDPVPVGRDFTNWSAAILFVMRFVDTDRFKKAKCI